MSNSLKFGTSGLRGLATDLAGTECRRYAAAFVRHLRSGGDTVPQVLIGRDLRDSSSAISTSVASALAGLGVAVFDCGELPTPALALEAMRRRRPAIMVTGSHIPADRNGLKFYRADGEIDKADEAGILAALGPPAPEGTGAAVAEPEALRRYAARYAAMLPAGTLAGLRIGVWQHSSVARDLLVEVLGRYDADVIPLGRSEHFVAVDTEAVSEDVATEIAGWVSSHGLDALVSTDGDADRPLVADETGAVLRGDVLGIFTATFLKADAVVTPVTSNSTIEATGYFRQVLRTKVGSPYVIDAMETAPGLVVGFEANGGVLLGSNVVVNGAALAALPTRDALLPILAVLGAARAAGQTLSQLAATLPPRFARSDRLEHVAAERSAALLDRLRADAAGFFAPQGRIEAISTIDGMRFELSSGDVVHYRPSGNAPELRCYTEAATAGRADELLAWGLRAAKAVVG
ncbi:MAG: phosphomannomutase [Devosia nanyangense]|uniref:Phosphomannomutase n=1 Tax=Devosia nanyangense TaxID=1228055 RepID=A0A933KX86_9HYPH|nr:phosphomannomutase [Devosia nanyangense]